MWQDIMTQLGHNISQLKDLLSYLASVKGDLSNITAPPFVLAPKSAIEIPSAWASRHALFLQPAVEPDPAQRALLVAKNYLCSLKNLVDEGSKDAAKKPLNPFLGELFIGTFETPDSTTRLIAEQVSHHPPVTACFMCNQQSGISSNGFVAHETLFSPSTGVTVRQLGYALIQDEKHGEKHLMTMPTLYIKGLTTGQPYPELQGPCYISSSSGFVTKIEFEGKGILGFGSKNRVEAKLYQSAIMEESLYCISGQWNSTLNLYNGKGTLVESFNVDDIPLTDFVVEPMESQSPWESRRAWGQVFEGITEGNIEKVNNHKNAIEESQREKRATEAQKGIEWNRLFFWRTQQDEEANLLLNAIPNQEGNSFDPARTDGVWKFVGIEEAEKLISQLSTDHEPLKATYEV